MLNDIIKTVFLQLNAQKIPVTPDMYRKYFCKEAKRLGMYTEDCNSLEVLKESLSFQNQAKLKKLNIDNMDTLLNYLAQQLSKTDNKEEVSNMIGMVALLKDTLEPSVGTYEDDNISSLEVKLKSNPNLLMDDELQKEIFALIDERKKLDRQVIMDKTAELATVLSTITQSLKNSLNASKDGNFNIKNIKQEIDKLDVAGFESDQALKDIKAQFISVADSIQTETDALSTVLSNESHKVTSLEQKVQLLEKQLLDAKKQSNTDFLTGAMTRKAFDEKLNALEAKFTAEAKDYSVIFFDLDHFKNINDTYGHDAGDKVLSTFSKLLLKEFNQFGLVARYGGEEFVALCPQKSVQECHDKAQEVRTILHKANFVYDNQKIKVTYSGGVCQRSEQDTVQTMLKQADKLLYDAKENGRDQIRF